MYNALVNKPLNCKYNPFGGLHSFELSQVIVPKSFIQELIQKIESPKKCIIELVGRKGRGKTSHLFLLQQHFHTAPLFQLNARFDFSQLENHDHPLIFIDSIHHLPFLKRLRIYKNTPKIILTTHVSRLIEYKLARRKYTSYRFKGIDREILTNIISNRINLALVQKESFEINPKEVKKLIQKYGDDYRSIFNHLYDTFQP